MSRKSNNFIFFSLIFLLFLGVFSWPKDASSYMYYDYDKAMNEEYDNDSENNNYSGNYCSGKNCDDYYNSEYCRYNYCGDYYNNSNYREGYLNPVPNISSASPNSATINSNTQSITVNGYNFTPNSIIQWNGQDKNTSYLNQNTLTFQIYSTELNSTGSNLISVFNPAPGGGYSNAVSFTVKNKTISANSTSSTSSTSSKSSSTTSSSNNSESEENSSNKSEENNRKNSFAANAIFGSNSFFPSSIIQWIIVFLLILTLVYVWRRCFVAKDTTPLKHA